MGLSDSMGFCKQKQGFTVILLCNALYQHEGVWWVLDSEGRWWILDDFTNFNSENHELDNLKFRKPRTSKTLSKLNENIFTKLYVFYISHIREL
jgi:hypothetical protein